MKYVFLLFLLTSCSPLYKGSSRLVPKYKQDQKVSFKVLDFYTYTCIPNGTILEYQILNNFQVDGYPQQVKYTVHMNTDSSLHCPGDMEIWENDITGVLK